MIIDQSANNDPITRRQELLAHRIVEAFHLDDNISPVETQAESYLQLDEDD